MALVLVVSACGGGSDSAELEALREEVASLKATTTVAPTTTVATTTTVVPTTTTVVPTTSSQATNTVLPAGEWEYTGMRRLVGTAIDDEELSVLGGFMEERTSGTVLRTAIRWASEDRDHCSVLTRGTVKKIRIDGPGQCLFYVEVHETAIVDGTASDQNVVTPAVTKMVMINDGRVSVAGTDVTLGGPSEIAVDVVAGETGSQPVVIEPVAGETGSQPVVIEPTLSVSTEATIVNEAFFELVRASETWDLGYTGAGSVVAVIDGTGFDASHQDFTDRVLLEVCTSAISEKCPNGEDVAEGPGMAAHLVGGRHGTGVAGVVHQLAPDAKFIFITTLGSTISSVGPDGTAFQWVIDNAEKYGIDALVMSYGRALSEREAKNMGLEAGCYDSQEQDADFAAMRALGVVPIVASGNDGRLNFMNYTACLDNTVSVGWVNEFGIIHIESNVEENLTFLAPSDLTAATIPDNGLYETFGGTSGAAPVVGALIAIGRQIKPDATVDELINTGRATGRSVDDYEIKDLRIVDFLAFSQTLAGLPVSPQEELAYEIDTVTSLMIGDSTNSEGLYSIGGFTLSQGASAPTQKLVWLSDTGGACQSDGNTLDAVAEGTCVYAVKLATWDQSTKSHGLWETKIIQFNIEEFTPDAVLDIEVGDVLGPSQWVSNAEFSVRSEGYSTRKPEFFSGDEAACDIDDTDQHGSRVSGKAPGTCVVKITFREIVSRDPYEFGEFEYRFFQINVN